MAERAEELIQVQYRAALLRKDHILLEYLESLGSEESLFLPPGQTYLPVITNNRRGRQRI
jgi:hypothetical protein